MGRDNSKTKAHLICELDELRQRLAEFETTHAKSRPGIGLVQALNPMEEKYRALVETTDTGFVIVDVSGRVVDANPTYVRLSGHETLEQILGQSVVEWTAERDQERNERAVRECLSQGEIRGFEVIYVDCEGREICVEINATVVQDNGEPFILSMCRDITQRKQMETSLLSREEELRATLESTADGILAIDANGKVVFANDHFAQMWRVPRELLDRNDDKALLAHVLGQLSEPDQFLARVRELYLSMDDHFDALRFCDGRVFERYSKPLLRKGRLAGRVWSFRDVTERDRTAEALRTSEERFRTIFEKGTVGMVRVANDGRFLQVNPAMCEMLGYSEDELLKLDIASVTHPDDVGPSSGQIAEAKAHRIERVDIEKRYLRKDGSIVWARTTGVWLFDMESNPLYSIAMIQDVSDRKKAEAQMLQTQKLESLGVLAGGIAHDFNNILMAILGNAGLALQDMSLVSPLRPMLEEIDVAAHRAADLCRQMLAYSGKGRFVVKAIDLSELAEEMGQILKVSISKRTVLRYNLCKSLPAVEADATQIRQVVMNLIINASEAVNDKDGVVSVTTGVMDCDRQYLQETRFYGEPRTGRHVYLEVSDTGCGMDAATMEKIFDPFFTTKFTGRGLGLAAVLGIVRGHRGGIKVYSEVGKGTSFKILVPAVVDPAVAPCAESADGLWRGSGTVLLVDDEEIVRTVASRMLECLGFTVLVANDGRQGLDIFRECRERIKCVLLDLTMPHMDGEETFREMRRIKPGVRVIMSSGYNEQEVINHFVGRGIAGFIQKPYQVDSLAATLKSVFEKPDAGK